MKYIGKGIATVGIWGGISFMYRFLPESIITNASQAQSAMIALLVAGCVATLFVNAN